MVVRKRTAQALRFRLNRVSVEFHGRSDPTVYVALHAPLGDAPSRGVGELAAYLTDAFASRWLVWQRRPGGWDIAIEPNEPE